MLPILTSLLITLLMLFSSTVLAKSYGSMICNNPENYCYTVKRGDSWEKLYPDETQRDLVMRLNRMNTRIYKNMVIARPKDILQTTIESIAPFAKQIDPPGEKIIIVSLDDLAFGAYNETGTLEYWGPVSGGRQYCPDIGRGCRTKTGTFEIYNTGGAGCKSSKYPVGRGGAPMPYCMFFNGGFALHGSYNVPGYNDSHGCVRMYVPDAKWLNNDFVMNDNVRVIVKHQR